MEVRRYRTGEEPDIRDVYFTSTRVIVSQEYTDDQVRRWAPDDCDMGAWTLRLQQTSPLVAVVDGVIVGFAELLPTGKIDYFYVHAGWQRQGVGTALMNAVEQEARQAGISRLHADVATTAIRFFLANGFQIITERVNIVCDAPARQYLVEKHPDQSPGTSSVSETVL